MSEDTDLQEKNFAPSKCPACHKKCTLPVECACPQGGTAMADVLTRLGDVKVKTADALRAAEADSGASVVLVAVVREFDSKADKANQTSEGDGSARDAVIELEQAGDSAKAAAEADPGIGESTKQAVLDAHLEICILKTEV